MRDVNVKNNFGEFYITENNYYKNEKVYNVTYETKEINVSDLLKGKLGDLLVSLISAIVSGLLTLVNRNVESTLVSLVLIVLVLFLILILFVFGICFIHDVIQMFKLKRIGKCVHFQSKLDLFAGISEKRRKNSRDFIGPLFKNQGGKIYRIVGCKCPLCKDDPVGNMRPRYIDKNNRYCFVCSENSNHKLHYDYKREKI